MRLPSIARFNASDLQPPGLVARFGASLMLARSVLSINLFFDTWWTRSPFRIRFPSGSRGSSSSRVIIESPTRPKKEILLKSASRMRAHKTREPEQHAHGIPSCAIRLSVYPRLRSRATSSSRSTLRHPILHAMDDVVERDLQRVRDRPDSDGRRIQDASLYAAQIGPLKSAFRAQSLLRKTRRPPELRYDCADGSLLEIRRLDMSSVQLHPEPSWRHVEAHKPTAYTPQFENQNERSARGIGSNFRRRSGRSRLLRYAPPNLEAEGKEAVSR
jgi:hypothetical protein